ncbi:MAG: VanW family protein [Clostridiales bacterium]|nr:VanW family protein [Clostridiales bacterium]
MDTKKAKERAMDELKKKKITKIAIGAAAGVLAVGGISTLIYFGTQKKDTATQATTTTSATLNESEIAASSEQLQKMQQEIDDTNFYQGITINGTDVGGKTKEEVKAMFSSDSTSAQVIDVQFKLGEEMIPLVTDGLQLQSNIDEVIEEAYNYGRTSTASGDDAVKERYETVEALKTTPKDFTVTYTLGNTDVATLVHETLDPCNTELVEAAVEGFDVEKLEFIITESSDGVVIDIDKAINDLKTSFGKDEFQVVIPLSAEITEATTSSEDLKSQLGLVSSTTSETTDNDNRNTNIRLVCEALDGLVLQPGEQFNFNDYIGQRTAEKGYKMAHGIYNGSMRDELGGGICQANTMLYQSVTKADLQVNERKNHSIPSTYVDKGTDATVTWYSPNFRFTNTSEYPIAIHAYYADLHVTVEIYGRLLPDGQYIELVGEHVRTISPSTVYVADPTLPVGEQKTTTSGRTGYDYASYKVWYDKDGNEIKRESYFSSHYPCRDVEVHVGTMGDDGQIHTMDPNGQVGDVDPNATESTVPDGSDVTTPDGSETSAPDDGTTPGGGDDTTPPAEDTTPAPAEDTTPAPVEDTTPAPAEDTTPAPAEETPAPVETPAETPAPETPADPPAEG